jgi:hypothetical protein
MQQKTKPKSSKQVKARSKPSPAAKSPKTQTATASGPKLVITILGDCTLANNQGLNPPHVSKSANGGFPHEVWFDAVVAGWVCLPAGIFTVDPVNPVAVVAGNPAGPFVIKPNTAVAQINFSHACNQPCGKGGMIGNGDVIIIDA